MRRSGVCDIAPAPTQFPLHHTALKLDWTCGQITEEYTWPGLLGNFHVEDSKSGIWLACSTVAGQFETTLENPSYLMNLSIHFYSAIQALVYTKLYYPDKLMCNVGQYMCTT